MDLIDRLRVLSAQAPKQLEHIKTEESTKTALVMPFINAMGYNVFDPSEVTPELIADVGIKKGEKVDYAILKDGHPIILIECKHHAADLAKEHASQLFRYFTVTKAKFGILTNGITYQFFSDTEEPNKMDQKPFFEFNLLDIKESHVDELKKFSKTTFDAEKAFNAAVDLKYTNEIKRIMAEELNSPSEDFTKFFASRIYSGRLLQSVRQRFAEIVKRALGQFIADKINDRLKIAAIEQEKPTQQDQKEELLPADKDKIVTTEEELEGYHIVKAILREIIDPTRLVIRDTLRFCGVLLDGKDRKPVCRMYLNTKNKVLGLFDKNKQEEKVPITSINDIYQQAERLKATIKMYEEEKPFDKKEENPNGQMSDTGAGSAKVVIDKERKIIRVPLKKWEQERGSFNLSGSAFGFTLGLFGGNVDDVRIYDGSDNLPKGSICSSDQGRYIQISFDKLKIMPQGAMLKVMLDPANKKISIMEEEKVEA